MFSGCSHPALTHRQPVVSLLPTSLSHAESDFTAGPVGFVDNSFGFISSTLWMKVQKLAHVLFMSNDSENWLRNAEAAEVLVVNVRTIKRWMQRQNTREALSAVRHGKQWRIPRPANLLLWESETRRRFEAIGCPLAPVWKAELRNTARRCDRYMTEANRIWLASYAKAMSLGRFDQKARNGILILWQAACEILDPLPRCEMKFERLKPRFAVWAKDWELKYQAEIRKPKAEFPRKLMRVPGQTGNFSRKSALSKHPLHLKSFGSGWTLRRQPAI